MVSPSSTLGLLSLHRLPATSTGGDIHSPATHLEIIGKVQKPRLGDVTGPERALSSRRRCNRQAVPPP